MELSKDQISKLPIFFIIGRPRSGTTLLRTLLDSHPNVIIPLECSFIIQLKNKYSAYIYWEEKDLKDFQTDLEKTRFFRLNNFDQQKLRQNLLMLKGPNSYQDFCKTVIASFKSLFPKSDISILGDKNPSYSLLFNRLFPIFSEAKFIHLVRDYRDNHASIVNARFENPLIAFTVKRWKESNRSIEKFKSNYHERFFTLRYEDLVRDPEKYLFDVCEFLGIPYNNEMLNFHKHKEDFKKLFSPNIFNTNKNLFDPVSQSNVGKWKNQLKRKEVIIADYIAGSYAEKYGYKRKYRESVIPYIIAVIHGIVAYYFLKAFINFGMSLPFWLQLRFSKNMHYLFGRFLYKLKKNQNVDVG